MKNQEKSGNDKQQKPLILVFSSLFPSANQPNAGLFIRERMFHVGEVLPIVVVSPVPWFPFQGLIRLLKPHYRPTAAKLENQNGVQVYHPKFFSVPFLFRQFDGLMMALSCYGLLKRLQKEMNYSVIDSHFAFPDGYAATWIAKRLRVPCTITIRGTEVPHSKTNKKRWLITALSRADRIFSVADFLKRHVVSLGVDAEKIVVVGNGVDEKKFYPLEKQDMKKKLDIVNSSPVIVSVGGLVERKGFHLVIQILPELIKNFPNLVYLVVGGASAEGNWESHLKKMVADLNLEKHVKFLGPRPPEELKEILSAADLFVLATRNEGWANVFLEAMACGLPVVTTKVGGNAEVVTHSDLGLLVPYKDELALLAALNSALNKTWDREKIIEYAKQNSWDSRVAVLAKEFLQLCQNQNKAQGS